MKAFCQSDILLWIMATRLPLNTDVGKHSQFHFFIRISADNEKLVTNKTFVVFHSTS